MKKKLQRITKKVITLLLIGLIMINGSFSINTYATVTTYWNLYNNGSSNSITNTLCQMKNKLHTRHYMQASEIESPDIEAYVKISGINVKLWDIERAQYVSFYGLASTSTIQCFSVAYRDSNVTTGDSQFYVDATHITNRYTMEGSIWYN